MHIYCMMIIYVFSFLNLEAILSISYLTQEEERHKDIIQEE